MKRFTLLLLFFLMINCFAFAQNEGNINLKKGEKFLVKNNTLETEIFSMPAEEPTKNNTNFITETNLEIKDVKDSEYIISVTPIESSIKHENINQIKDSNYIHKNFNVTKLDSSQEINITKFGRLLTKKIRTATAFDDELNQMENKVKDFFGDPYDINYALSFAFANIPKNIKTGYIWYDSSSQDGMKKKLCYTISKIKGEYATIEISGIFDINVQAEVHGINFRTKATGNLKGKEIANHLTGVIQTINTTLELSGIGQIMEQQIPFSNKIISTTTVKIL